MQIYMFTLLIVMVTYHSIEKQSKLAKEKGKVIAITDHDTVFHSEKKCKRYAGKMV